MIEKPQLGKTILVKLKAFYFKMKIPLIIIKTPSSLAKNFLSLYWHNLRGTKSLAKGNKKCLSSPSS